MKLKGWKKYVTRLISDERPEPEVTQDEAGTDILRNQKMQSEAQKTAIAPDEIPLYHQFKNNFCKRLFKIENSYQSYIKNFLENDPHATHTLDSVRALGQDRQYLLSIEYTI